MPKALRSRCTLTPERPHEKEALAVLWSLGKFRTYLCAAEFTIYTDHRNLLWLLNLDADKGRLSRRWAALMAPWQVKAVTPKELKEGKIEQHKGRIISGKLNSTPTYQPTCARS